MDGITDTVDVGLNELWEIVKDRKAWHVAVHGVAKSHTELVTDHQEQLQPRTFASVFQVSTGEGNGKPLQYSCLKNPMNNMKRQKYMTLKDKLLRSVGT